jgi:hypothetical protein
MRYSSTDRPTDRRKPRLWLAGTLLNRRRGLGLYPSFFSQRERSGRRGQLRARRGVARLDGRSSRYKDGNACRHLRTAPRRARRMKGASASDRAARRREQRRVCARVGGPSIQ